MSFTSGKKKRSYSYVYKMYRRIRYIRYKRRILREAARKLERMAAEEEQTVKEKLADFRKQDRIQRRIKLREEKENARKYHANLREELKEQKKQADLEIKKLSAERRQKEYLLKKTTRNERRRMLKQYLKIQIRNIRNLPRSINARNIRTFFLSVANFIISVRTFLIISFNSTVLFILAYLSLFLIGQFITVVAAGFFDYPTIVYYYEVYFIISPEDWYHDSVKTIFSAGPLVNFVIGISFLIIYNRIREDNGIFKLFFLWGYLHAVNLLFGALLVGTLFETGIGHVISWMYIADTGRVMYSIISIFILVVAGLMATRPFLISANTYYRNLDSGNRTFFMTAQVVMPYILGNVFLFVIRLPRIVYYDTFIVITLILSILPILMAYKAYPQLYFEEESKRHRMAWMNGIILTIVVIIFRGVLEVGIRFGG